MAAKPKHRAGLVKEDRKLIRSLSRLNVEATLVGLRPFINRSKWLGLTNRYSKDTIARIKSDAGAKKIREPQQLSQYISASCLLHCSDGWSYLGKAILSTLRGDPHRARHLAYYAELRAAVSLLATEGIGIFNNRHFVINSPNSIVRMHGGRDSTTHRFTWLCLDYWANRASSGDLFSKIVRPYGRDLDDWLTPLGGGSVVAPQARNWLRQWGMDLKMLPEDRDARNESSYQPDGIPDVWRTNATSVLNFARDLWVALEPSPTSRFETIDRHILRIVLSGVFKGRTGKDVNQDPIQFKAFVSPVIDNQGFQPEARRQWLDFITREISPGDTSMFLFSGASSQTRNNSDLAIISRATLLLRFASGSASQLLAAAGMPAEDLKFWWEAFGQGRGFWEGNKQSNELLDLWANVAAALQEIDEFHARTAEADRTFFSIGNDLGKAIVGLGNSELVALWSLVAE
jgi:hypothetical protein